jgi:trimeric autotransporter adhesin
MRCSGRNGWIIGAAALLVLGSGCTGFFVNQPNSISVTQGGSSTLSVVAPNSVQLTATATFNSGTKDISKSASWQSSSACATVSSTGLVTGLGPASNVTITASSGGVSGSITGTVTGGTGQTLTISSNPQQPFSLSSSGSTVQFTATDSNSNDVTNSATWTSGDTTLLAFSSTPGLATLLAQGTTTVNASIASSGTCSSGSESVTINQ